MVLNTYPPVAGEAQCSAEGMPLHSLCTSYHKENQQMHIICESHSNVLIHQLLHVSGLTGPASGSAQLHKTII
jgi:hypothetical protein